ncbi:MAG: hypothetical protein AB8B79_21745 [Granulosicoccus sp.]
MMLSNKLALTLVLPLFVLGLLVGSVQQTSAASEPGDPRGLVIVMNVNIDIPSIDDDELRRLFTGKSRRLPNGQRAALASYAPESSFFNERMLGLSDAEVAALWSRLRFSGRTPPPRTFDSVKALVDYVASTPNALAYMPASVARQGVRVISNLPR